MPPLSFLGNLLLLCCSASNDTATDDHAIGQVTINAVDNRASSNVSVSPSTTVDSLPSWIASPLNRTRQSYPSDELIKTIHPSYFHLNVKFSVPDNGEENKINDSDIQHIRVNYTNISTDNFMHINISNNGAPISKPVVITGPNSTIDLISISILMDKNETAEMVEDDVLPWWKTSVIYNIYPRSFMDSDGSGEGDLNGITSRLDYLKDLGIGAVWISPFYVSPMIDFGYDIADFKNIDPKLGTLQDFDELLSELHKRDLKMIIDFIPNHSSDEHDWFTKSVQRIDPYTDYYVWMKAKGINETGSPIPPNNWLSRFGSSAWEWSDIREEFYLHQFRVEQPDLNVRNPLVMEELDAILRFWLDRSVDGFRIDALNFLFEIEDLTKDEPRDEMVDYVEIDNYMYLDHIYTTNQPETTEAIRRWRKIVDSFADKLLIVDVQDKNINNVINFYGNKTDRLSHFPLNLNLITELHNRSSVSGNNLKRIINMWISNMPEDQWPNFVLGNHYSERVASRLEEDLIDSLNMVLLLLPGTPTTYYGEEIGIKDSPYEDRDDSYDFNFDPESFRNIQKSSISPMQWSNSTSAGFSQNDTIWLPVHENFDTLNVDFQNQTTQSSLSVYRSLTQLRKNRAFTHGNTIFPLESEIFFIFERHLKDNERYVVVINTSESIQKLSANETVIGEVLIRSSTDTRNETSPGSTVDLQITPMLGGEGIVLKIK